MTYYVAPHLNYFTIPIADFIAARPEIDGFAICAYIFSRAHSTPRILLLQRALSDSSPGCWEGPGGACEPENDKTVLDSLVRETFEESGLHVSRVVDLVAVDCWEHRRRNGDKIRLAKYSFLVEVCEGSKEFEGKQEPVPTSEIPIRLEPTEHQAFVWATEDDVQLSIESTNGLYKFPSPPTGSHALSILRAFQQVERR
ncbi:uncharacterized protein N7529_002143 [Penicillium soppii]|uniref:uncharacterized protein n=1 Tax=Penicillium soppii TaxID=69789 RepID=UPI002549BC77|nr:uncharacterized protein N7529_002143 [Penicillium soppii]KAJ5873713.1 hypothetical protein N7529_002143 [Penicillium soppii]